MSALDAGASRGVLTDAAAELVAATRRLMAAVATCALPDEELRELTRELDGLVARAGRRVHDRVRRVPWDDDRRDEVRAGSPWVMFPGNPQAIQVAVSVEGDQARAELDLGPLHEGPPGLLHGGFAAQLMDAVLGVLVMTAVAPAYTARLDLAFQRPTALDRPVVLGGRVAGARGRVVEAQGWIEQDGVRVVTAHGVFVRVPSQPDPPDGSAPGGTSPPTRPRPPQPGRRRPAYEEEGV